MVSAALLAAPPAAPPRSAADMQALEAAHRVVDLFIWLSFRLEHGFESRERAERVRAALGARIEEGLAALGRAPPRKRPRKPGSKRCAQLLLHVSFGSAPNLEYSRRPSGTTLIST